MRLLILLALFFSFNKCFSQEDIYPENGAKTNSDVWLAFKNATIHIDASTVKKGTLIIKNGKIIGVNQKIPNGCIEIDLLEKHIYPSFIDMYSEYGLKKAQSKKSNPRPQIESNKLGAYGWNEAIKAENNAADDWAVDEKSAKVYRDLGFGSVLTHRHDGIVRGTSSLVLLGNESENKMMLIEKAASQLSLSKGTSKQTYPSSLMGVIALLRQTYYDAEFYSDKLGLDLTLKAFKENLVLPSIIEANDKLNILRADKICDEFGLQYMFKGSGNEYQRIDAIKSTQGALILPLNFPKVYDVSDPYLARQVSTEQMKHWELAPSNPKFVSDAKIDFAFTVNDLKDKKDFWKNIRLAVARGLTPEMALEALTTAPAKMLNVSDKLGSLSKGKMANFIISDKDLFIDEGEILATWIAGKEYNVKTGVTEDIRGEFSLNINGDKRTLTVSGKLEKLQGEIEYLKITDSTSLSGDLVLDEINKRPIKVTKVVKTKAEIKLKDEQVTIAFKLNNDFYSLGGVIYSDGGLWKGKGTLPNGEWSDWAAVRLKKEKEKETKKSGSTDSLTIDLVNFPSMAFGWDSLPTNQTILIKDATIWTLETEGTLTEKDLLVVNGKIVKIGDILDSADPNAIIIEGKGLHVTPGIIDEHSHIAISRGVNESGQASTAEVSIASVVNSDDINIYRQLAGGVTTAHLLHGSANPIGGQSAIIKLKWGSLPEEMKYTDMPLFIKFALGENVKQSNWGQYNSVRFPQTRMGVEQVYYDHFIRAKEYDESWKLFNASAFGKKSKNTIQKPRVDLELEVLSEILNKKRFVSCHSYIQSEINMLMTVADSMNFTLNTFTHILEGYKVADKMKEHGAGGSTFSDWWAYKYEVNDAIPHNASLMNEMGIVTAINSDDAEMARRLNQEAAKGIKYGGMSEIDALKMVTLNPAKLLHIDDKVGSIAVGKDADLVVWSDHPLSVYAKPRQTIIEGVVYYDINRDKRLRKEVAAERARLISKMLKAKLGGEPTQNASGKKNTNHNCNIITDDGNE